MGKEGANLLIQHSCPIFPIPSYEISRRKYLEKVASHLKSSLILVSETAYSALLPGTFR
jgi:sialic acid synthase SpsE